MKSWREVARTAEETDEWDAAISAAGEYAECYSKDAYRHDAHLCHMDLLAKAGRLDELAIRGETDVHVSRRLDRFLFEQGRDGDLRQRADLSRCLW